MENYTIHDTPTFSTDTIIAVYNFKSLKEIYNASLESVEYLEEKLTKTLPNVVAIFKIRKKNI